ncbi:hypothetical protein LJC14_02900 [Treponema sp. OttesenSCG-928-L16]|nr:hypothetical protein [Treponema sp. OttesenSCG-928-L16]
MNVVIDTNIIIDALLEVCAKSWKAAFIITRNTKDFVNSPVKVISPADFPQEYMAE